MENIKYVILSPDKNKYTFKYMSSNDCIVENLYQKPNVCLIYKLARKILYFLGFKFHYKFYGDWTKYIDDENIKIIVFDSCRPYHRLAKVLQKHKNTVVYFWNPISASKKKIDNLKAKFTVYSYSEIEASKYGLRYNPQFLPKIKLNQDEEIYDVFFCGRDKGRVDDLVKIATFFDKPYIYVFSKDTKKKDGVEYSNKYMSYDDYLLNVSKSKALLEILPCSTAGMTLRTIEAAFYKKKLITNNTNIKSEKIYCENNILIIDNDTNANKIKEFMDRPFFDINEKDCNYYEFTNWLTRF